MIRPTAEVIIFCINTICHALYGKLAGRRQPVKQLEHAYDGS